MVATLLERARKAREDESGFTLIELLIVIVILGILAGIVVFAVGGVTDRGTKAACQSDLKSVEVAVEANFAQNGTYPADDAAAQAALVPGFLHSYPDTVTYAKSGTSFTVTGAKGASRDCSGITVS
jgi:general secretion pathway protein G